MFNPTREQARDFWFESWRKFRSNEPISAIEAIAVELVTQHPEYQMMLADRTAYLDRYRDRDYPPEFGETNPFLHLGMHLSLREQVSIDQPPGIRDAHRKLSERRGNTLEAEHEMMDCLGEMIWHAQRHRSAPDPAIYFACLARKLGEIPS
jgi:hypothetical protein